MLCSEHRLPASIETLTNWVQVCGAYWSFSPSRRLPTAGAHLWCLFVSHQMQAAPTYHSSRHPSTPSRIHRSHLHKFSIHPWADLIELPQHRVLDDVDHHLSRKDVCAASQ